MFQQHTNLLCSVVLISCNGLQVVLGATLGIMRPSAVTWLDSNRFTYALGFLMLSMGLTLTIDDFKKVTSDCICCQEEEGDSSVTAGAHGPSRMPCSNLHHGVPSDRWRSAVSREQYTEGRRMHAAIQGVGT